MAAAAIEDSGVCRKRKGEARSMRIAVCDDEEIQRSLLKSYLEAWAEEKGRALSVTLFASGEEFLKSWQEAHFDVVLLDIQMPDMDGMSVARRLRETDGQTGIFFVTGYEDYLVQGYEVEAFRYLIKPVSDEKLREGLELFLKKRGGEKRVLMVETPEGTRRVDADGICYMEAFAHSCELHTLTELVTVKSGISALEKEAARLGIPLFRCHRSYAVNIAQIRAIEREAALLADGTRIPVSRRLYQELNRRFIDYFLKKGR